MEPSTRDQLIAWLEHSTLFPNVDKRTWSTDKNRIEEGIRIAWKGSRSTDTDPIVKQYPMSGIPVRKPGDREKIASSPLASAYLMVEEPPNPEILALFSKLPDYQDESFPFLTYKEYSTMYRYLRQIIPDKINDIPAFENPSSEQIKMNESILVILATFWQVRGYYGTINYLLKKPLWGSVPRDLWKIIIGQDGIGTVEEMYMLYIRIIKNFLPPVIDYDLPSNSTFWDFMNVYVAADAWDKTHSPDDLSQKLKPLQILPGSLQFVKNTRIRMVDIINAVNVWYPTRSAQANQLYTYNWQTLMLKHYVKQWLNLVGDSLLVKKGNLYDYELLKKNWKGPSIKPPPIQAIAWRLQIHGDLIEPQVYPPPRGDELALAKRIYNEALINTNVIFSEYDFKIISGYYKKNGLIFQPFDVTMVMNDYVYRGNHQKDIDEFLQVFYYHACYVQKVSKNFTLEPKDWEWKDPALENSFSVPDDFYKPPPFSTKGKSVEFMKLVNTLEYKWISNGAWTLYGRANDGYHIDPSLYSSLVAEEQAFFSFCNRFPIPPIRKQGFWNSIQLLDEEKRQRFYTLLRVQFRCYIVWVHDNLTAQNACLKSKNNTPYTQPGDVFNLGGKQHTMDNQSVKNAVINLGVLEDADKDTPPWYAYTGIGAIWSLMGDFLFGADFWNVVRNGVVKLFEKVIELLRETVRLALNVAGALWDEIANWLGFSPWWLVAIGGVLVAGKVGVDVIEYKIEGKERQDLLRQ